MSGIFGVLLAFIVVMNLYGFFYLKRRVDKNKQEWEQWKSEQVKPKRKRMKQEPKQNELQKHMDELFKVVTKDFILLEGDERVFLKDVLYFTSKTNFVQVQTKNEILKSMTDFDSLIKRLPPNFIQCNESQVVNVDWVSGVGENELSVGNTDVLTVSEQFRTFFNQLTDTHGFKNYPK